MSAKETMDPGIAGVAALLVSLGCEDDHLDAAFDLLKPKAPPPSGSSLLALVSDFRAAIAEARTRTPSA